VERKLALQAHLSRHFTRKGADFALAQIGVEDHNNREQKSQGEP
jgi:hypothetical protein